VTRNGVDCGFSILGFGVVPESRIQNLKSEIVPMLATAAPYVALGLTTLVLVAALRSRWKRTPVLMRCVVFSLYAHFFFATLAYTTHFSTWRPGPFGSGRGAGEVRVRMTTETLVETPPEMAEPVKTPWEPVGELPAELALAATAVTKQDSSAITPSSERKVTAPPLPELPPVSLPEKKPASSALDSVAEVLAAVAPRYAEPVAVEPPRAQASERSAEAQTSPSSSPPRAPASAATPPDLYRLRFAEDRAGIVESGGGSLDTEAAVKLALEWLVGNQESDGRWSPAKHGAGRGTPPQGQDRGDTGADADTGITALAILALMGAGHTHLEGDHREAVQHGLEFLLKSQRSDGCLAGNAKLFASMYCHGMATLAIAEALAITRDGRLRPFVERAVAYTVAAQHSGGGWRYQPHDLGDMSQFGWQIMALKSAELAGVKIPEATKLRSQRFLQTMSSGRSGGLCGYRDGERPSRTMTAEALLCRYLLMPSTPTATRDEATAFVLQELPTAGASNVYYWYYGTLAMRLSRGAAWEKWNDALQQQLVQTQRGEGDLAGSWDPDRVWGGYGGRVYQTALSALCLEAYYRYDTAAIDGRKLR
jgi:hypothetical protein